ncbi:MAG: hypothetical protein M3P97_05275 [Actinomycetota bacterium]|nr:hypothetical protein [Actinomycetota bacterium]
MAPPARVAVVALILAVLAPACSGDGSGSDGAAASSSTTSTARASPTSTFALTTSTSTSTSTSTEEPSSAAPAVASELVLGPEGLGAVAFGDPAGEVVAELARLLGPPVDDAPLASCPTGEVDRLVQFGGLTVLLGGPDGAPRFVGWDLEPGSGPAASLVTAEGVGIGATLAELRAAYGSRLVLTEGPFAPGFGVGARAPGRLSGTLTGTGAADTVATLSAGGATCGG